MQQRYQLFLICIDIIDQQGAKLRIAILFDHVNDLMLRDKISHRIGKRECLHAAIIEADILRFETIQCFFAGAVTTAKRQDCRCIEFRITNLRLGHQGARRFPLDQQAIQHFLVFVASPQYIHPTWCARIRA